jgi:predicted ATPase
MVSSQSPMFVHEMLVENFRCLRSVKLTFAPLTVFVGPNGAGKSAVLAALDPHVKFRQPIAWRHDPTAGLHRGGTLSMGRRFEDTTAQGHISRLPWSYLRLHLRPGELRKPNQLQEARLLEQNGENLANVFSTLPRPAQQRVAERLCQLVPLYQDLATRPSSVGHHRLVFQDRWTSELWFEPQEVSDGTMVLLAFLTLTHLENPPDLLAIEHPEESLHPYLLENVIGMLRQLATGKLGPKAVQVVLSTHSPLVLDFVEPSEVRFLSRDLNDGSTTVREAPTDSEEWKNAFEEYEKSLGEVWLAGGLGGVPPMPAGQ